MGCGPAGLSTAQHAATLGLRVAVVDPAPTAAWRNNYGVWVDDFVALGHGECLTRSWPTARVTLDDGSFLKLDRAYAQVDRGKLKAKLLRGAAAAGVEFATAKAAAFSEVGQLSAVALRPMSGGGSSGGGGEGGGESAPSSPDSLPQLLHGRAVLDASGHARRLVRFGSDFTPGYQAAYGVLAEVESHPFPPDEMLFMDWRDSHLNAEPDAKARNGALPTFLYAMPFSPTRVFMEETSLVARPGVDFDDIKLRMRSRLEALGVKIVRILEEEHCLIPMGGVLPQLPQRCLGVGGTAGMVHPSTGFMLSKTLDASSVLASSLAAGLQRGLSGDDLSSAVWDAIWPGEQRRMRTFMCFGMETLMQLDLAGTRRFFGTFFALPKDLWAGFLSWKVRPVGLIGLGLSLFSGFTPAMRLEFIAAALPFMPSFAANFGRPAGDGNKFDSRPWGGLRLPAPRRPDAPPGATQRFLSATRGRTLLPPPNPAAAPILATGVDFAALVGLPPALAGGASEAGGGGHTAAHNVAASEPHQQAPLHHGGGDAGDGAAPPPPPRRDDREWTAAQQRKKMSDQPPLATLLPPLRLPLSGAASDAVDVAVIGCGPAGLALAAELAERGLSVALLAPDAPIVNNYGVWADELEGLGGAAGCVGSLFTDALYYTGACSIRLERGCVRILWFRTHSPLPVTLLPDRRGLAHGGHPHRPRVRPLRPRPPPLLAGGAVRRRPRALPPLRGILHRLLRRGRVGPLAHARPV